ncbi:hypothetical protein RYR28_001398 [Edwardsiella piscicida]|uniref:hypothetical protein n=1 Tax=Edwardsiella piscicida TaxID=1263550 RepID=UPI0029118FBE|nr:hypothetical protein [Edwardsiella piscicida]ELM3722653.1 hypothetical protein [Edwardsiella piscicida]ELM3729392.1 hypothetical protein [Edwardsiella piscicida]ELV7536602.1 hypothetical protein [Edwardsiella piscicida]
MGHLIPIVLPPHRQLDSDVDMLEHIEPTPLFDRVTDSPTFLDGLTTETHRTGELRSAHQRGISYAFNYIARHTNPHRIRGMFSNVLSLFSGRALNQNGVICSKAVEQNLAALECGMINDFWVAESTAPGGLPQNVAPEHYVSVALQTDRPLSGQLLQRSQEGSRNIIMAPVRGKAVSHAMNLVRTEMGAIVIDGQFGLRYNLNDAGDRERFDKNYGQDRGIGTVQIYPTGAAPKAPDIDDGALLEE